MKQRTKLILLFLFLTVFSALYCLRQINANRIFGFQCSPACTSNTAAMASVEPEHAEKTPTSVAAFDNPARSQKQSATSVHPSENDDTQLEIADMRIPLFFTASEMSQKTKKVIAADLSLVLSGVEHLVVPDELVDSYRKILETKRRHPDIFDSLNEFAALLRDSPALMMLAQNVENADRLVCCSKTSRKQGLRVLEEYASLNMHVRHAAVTA